MFPSMWLNKHSDNSIKFELEEVLSIEELNNKGLALIYAILSDNAVEAFICVDEATYKRYYDDTVHNRLWIIVSKKSVLQVNPEVRGIGIFKN